MNLKLTLLSAVAFTALTGAAHADNVPLSALQSRGFVCEVDHDIQNHLQMYFDTQAVQVYWRIAGGTIERSHMDYYYWNAPNRVDEFGNVTGADTSKAQLTGANWGQHGQISQGYFRLDNDGYEHIGFNNAFFTAKCIPSDEANELPALYSAGTPTVPEDVPNEPAQQYCPSYVGFNVNRAQSCVLNILINDGHRVGGAPQAQAPAQASTASDVCVAIARRGSLLADRVSALAQQSTVLNYPGTTLDEKRAVLANSDKVIADAKAWQADMAANACAPAAKLAEGDAMVAGMVAQRGKLAEAINEQAHPGDTATFSAAQFANTPWNRNDPPSVKWDRYNEKLKSLRLLPLSMSTYEANLLVAQGYADGSPKLKEASDWVCKQMRETPGSSLKACDSPPAPAAAPAAAPVTVPANDQAQGYDGASSPLSLTADAKSYDNPEGIDGVERNIERVAGIQPRHYCDKGYCADESIVHIGPRTDYGYFIKPDNREGFKSVCTQPTADAHRTCWTTQGRMWVDEADGKGGWITVRKLRDHFPAI
jgi:hypothetical protein